MVNVLLTVPFVMVGSALCASGYWLTGAAVFALGLFVSHDWFGYGKHP